MTVRTSPACRLHGYVRPFVSLRVFELTPCRRFACFAVCVVRRDAILAAEDAQRRLGVDPGRVSVRCALVADDGPGAVVLALDGILDRACGTAPGNQAAAFEGDNGTRRNGVRRNGTAGDLECVCAQKLRTSGHILFGHDDGVDPAVVESPPLAGFALLGKHFAGDVGWDGLPTKLVIVGLKRPEEIAGDFGVVLHGGEDLLQVGLRGPVGDVPTVFGHDIDFAMAGDQGGLLREGLSRGPCATHAEDLLPVRIVLRGDDVGSLAVEKGAAFIEGEEIAVVLVKVLLIDGLDEGSDSVDPIDDGGHVGAAAGQGRYEAARIAVLPGENGGIVLVIDAGKRVLVIQERLDMLLKTSDDDWIGEEVLGSGRAAVFEVLSGAALLAVGAVADKGENEAQATVVRGLKSIVDVLESLGIEFAQPGLDTEIAADTVAQSLRTDDAGAHGLGGVHGVVDFKMAGIA